MTSRKNSKVSAKQSREIVCIAYLMTIFLVAVISTSEASSLEVPLAKHVQSTRRLLSKHVFGHLDAYYRVAPENSQYFDATTSFLVTPISGALRASFDAIYDYRELARHASENIQLGSLDWIKQIQQDFPTKAALERFDIKFSPLFLEREFRYPTTVLDDRATGKTVLPELYSTLMNLSSQTGVSMFTSADLSSIGILHGLIDSEIITSDFPYAPVTIDIAAKRGAPTPNQYGCAVRQDWKGIGMMTIANFSDGSSDGSHGLVIMEQPGEGLMDGKLVAQVNGGGKIQNYVPRILTPETIIHAELFSSEHIGKLKRLFSLDPERFLQELENFGFQSMNESMFPDTRSPDRIDMHEVIYPGAFQYELGVPFGPNSILTGRNRGTVSLAMEGIGADVPIPEKVITPGFGAARYGNSVLDVAYRLLYEQYAATLQSQWGDLEAESN